MAAVVMLTGDLIFATKVAATAAARDLICTTVRSERALANALADDDVRLAIVDMELPPEILEASATLLAGRSGLRTIAYYPHVQGELRARAASLGITEILPRSSFAASLDDIIGRIQVV